MDDLRPSPNSAFGDALSPKRSGRSSGAAGVSVCEVRYAGIASVAAARGQSSALAIRIREDFGLKLPTVPRRVASGQTSAIWAGPDRWLITRAAVTSEDAARRLASSLAGLGTVVDLGHALALLRVSGVRARDTLAKGVPIDLHPRAFQTGHVALTSVSHIAVQLWQTGEEPTYEIAVPRSCAQSFLAWLAHSAAVFGLDRGEPLRAEAQGSLPAAQNRAT